MQTAYSSLCNVQDVINYSKVLLQDRRACPFLKKRLIFNSTEWTKKLDAAEI